MSYRQQTWINGPFEEQPLASPLTQGRFNHMEDGIDALLQQPAVLPNDGDLLVWDAAAGTVRAIPAPSYIEGGDQSEYQYVARAPQARGFPITATDPRLVAGISLDGGKRMAAPSLAKDGTTLLCAVTEEPMYRYAAGYTTPKTWLKKSLDNGATWQTMATKMWEVGGKVTITALLNGNYLSCAQYKFSSDGNWSIAGRISADKGLTWGTVFPIVNVYDTAGTPPVPGYAPGHLPYLSPAPVQLIDGTILLPIYGNGAPPKIFASVDDGASWTYRSTLTANLFVFEATIQQLPNGDLVALTHSLETVASRFLSTDNGVTWSAAVALWVDCDSRIDWVRMRNGRSIAYYSGPFGTSYPLGNFTDEGKTPRGYVRYSDDDFVTYSAPAPVHGVGGYSGPGGVLQVAPGICYAVQSQFEGSYNNSSSGYGDIVGRYLIDGQGVAPTGQSTFLPALRRAGSSVVAYDSFNRPATARSLGSADSGQLWVEAAYEGFAPGSWRLFNDSGGGYAASDTFSAGLKPVVLDPGVTDGSVEADFRWVGTATTYPNLGLVGRSNLVTRRYLVTRLEIVGPDLVSRVYILQHNYPMTPGQINTQLLHTSVALPYLVRDVWYRAKLVLKGMSAQFYIDDTLINSINGVVANNYTGAYAMGTNWGIYGTASSSGQHQFKNVVVSSV